MFHYFYSNRSTSDEKVEISAVFPGKKVTVGCIDLDIADSDDEKVRE